MSFEQLLEEELERISEDDILSYDDAVAFLEAEGFDQDIIDEVLSESSLKKRVSSDGSVRRTRSKQQRSKRATRTTGMSKAALRRRGRKAARTRTRGSQRDAKRKRKKSMRIRKRMGI